MIVFPFNFNPVSVDVKTNTTNEAVATGKYARVTVSIEGSGEFYINDELALRGTQNAQTTQTATTMETDGSGRLFSDNISGGTAAYTYSETTHQRPITETVWVPAGTNLKVSGTARYTLQLFNVAT